MIGFITIYFNIKFQYFLGELDGKFSQTLIINVLEHLE